jgi:FKBP-type peptidyl-prolyl cis-trans isomerase FkpA
MQVRSALIILTLALSSSACDKQVEQDSESPPAGSSGAVTQTVDVAPGLTMRILRRGYGRGAEAGDAAEVHYTGWLFDESADNHRGTKFDSSVDRGERFQFLLGAGRVIKGWDQGIAGMLIGEVRELTIAPEMGYGDRGAGNLIPPGATLVFEVELFGLQGPADSASD